MGNCQGNEYPPAPDAYEALILVVGNDSAFKARVAQDLAEAANATPQPLVNKAGVRFFHRNDKPIVIDTTPFKTVKDLSREDTARLWVSQNSLRQRSGQVVLVICTIASTDPKDEIYQEPNAEQNEFSWLRVLACVFEKNRNQVMILVNSDGSSTDEAAKTRLRPVLSRDGFRWPENIIFDSPSIRGGYLNNPIIKTVLQSSLDVGKADVDESPTRDNDKKTEENEGTGINNQSTISTFQLPMVAIKGGGRYGPWGSENIILFGFSGSGKSTFAKMVTTGRLDGLDSLSKKFSTSSGARGETKKVTEGQGRGWRVFDTPGLGESNTDKKSGVTTDRAGKLIREHVVLEQGDYCHYIFVIKKDRVTDKATNLWGVFQKLFNNDGIEGHITIVVSGADQDWLDRNERDLRAFFPGSASFIPAEFPSTDPNNEVEEELQDIRLKSLTALEESLASLCRLDLSCRMGIWSWGTQLSMLARRQDVVIKPGESMGKTHSFGPLAGMPSPSVFFNARASLARQHKKSRTFMPGRTLTI